MVKKITRIKAIKPRELEVGVTVRIVDRGDEHFGNTGVIDYVMIEKVPYPYNVVFSDGSNNVYAKDELEII
jgi:hypothetical protein